MPSPGITRRGLPQQLAAAGPLARLCVKCTCTIIKPRSDQIQILKFALSGPKVIAVEHRTHIRDKPLARVILSDVLSVPINVDPREKTPPSPSSGTALRSLRLPAHVVQAQLVIVKLR